MGYVSDWEDSTEDEKMSSTTKGELSSWVRSDNPWTFETIFSLSIYELIASTIVGFINGFYGKDTEGFLDIPKLEDPFFNAFPSLIILLGSDTGSVSGCWGFSWVCAFLGATIYQWRC